MLLPLAVELQRDAPKLFLCLHCLTLNLSVWTLCSALLNMQSMQVLLQAAELLSVLSQALLYLGSSLLGAVQLLRC